MPLPSVSIVPADAIVEEEDSQLVYTSSPTTDMNSARTLPDVPEGSPLSPTTTLGGNGGPYYASQGSASGSTSTLNVPVRKTKPSRRASSASTHGRTAGNGPEQHMMSSRRTPSTSTIGGLMSTKGGRNKALNYLPSPRLIYERGVERVSSALMYWSRAPVYGVSPAHGIRSHSANLIDSTVWIFGGADQRDSFNEMFCFDIETMQWTHPEIIGTPPPPIRAHTATTVDKRLIIFGGGHGPTYYDDVYVFDTIARQWSRPTITGSKPCGRRAHSAVYYQGKIWVFGGGTGQKAVNDLWCLDVTSPSKMKWTEVRTTGANGKIPSPRGYHTANVIGNLMMVLGGSDANVFSAEIWALDLDTFEWREVGNPNKEKREQMLAHTSVQVGSYLVVNGGHNGVGYLADTRFFSLITLAFEERRIYGTSPTKRGYHTCVLGDSRLFFFGGFDGTNVFDDVFIIDLAASAYLPQVTSFTIELDPQP